jgi:hypothetical protein
MKSAENSTSPFFKLTAFFQIHDALVMAIVHGQREVDAASDPFIGTGVAKSLSPEHIIARGDLDP